MKKYSLLSIAIGLLLVHASFAENPAQYRIPEQCRSVITHLEALIHSKPHDACTGDIQISEAYITAASIKINHNKYDDALIYLHRGKKELYNIIYSHSYCACFAPFVKKELAQIIEIIDEVEDLKRLKA